MLVTIVNNATIVSNAIKLLILRFLITFNILFTSMKFLFLLYHGVVRFSSTKSSAKVRCKYIINQIGGFSMLYIKLGMTPNTIYDVDNVFDLEYEDEWLEDPFVKDMILDVDKTKVISSHLLESPVFGAMAPEGLSGGVKALIMMLKTDFVIWATACGDNCSKWIIEIAKKKDLTISLEHLMEFPDELDAIMINTGHRVHGFMEFMSEVFEYGYQSEYEED